MSISNWRMLHNDSFDRCRVLVTGGAGFIGSHLTEALLNLGAEVVVIDDLTGGDLANIAPLIEHAHNRLHFEKGSVLDQPLLKRVMDGCTFVFHQAAWGSVPRSIELPEHYHNINTTGTFNVLETSRKTGVKRVMFAASSSAYGDTIALPKVETMPPRPKSPYAATKVAGEALMRAYANSYSMDTASLRYFNIFGPRQNANSAYAAVIAAFAKALLSNQRPVIFGDGEQSRDFTFVENAVHANLLAARNSARIGGEVMNVAAGHRVTVNKLATQLAGLLGVPDLTPIHQPLRDGDVLHSLADLQKSNESIGYQPIITFERGLEITAHWYRTAIA